MGLEKQQEQHGMSQALGGPAQAPSRPQHSQAGMCRGDSARGRGCVVPALALGHPRMALGGLTLLPKHSPTIPEGLTQLLQVPGCSHTPSPRWSSHFWGV